jgi:hypothetical protein
VNSGDGSLVFDSAESNLGDAAALCAGMRGSLELWLLPSSDLRLVWHRDPQPDSPSTTAAAACGPSGDGFGSRLEAMLGLLGGPALTGVRETSTKLQVVEELGVVPADPELREETPGATLSSHDLSRRTHHCCPGFTEPNIGLQVLGFARGPRTWVF